MYWRRRSVPELVGLTDEELKRYWRQRFGACYAQPGYWVVSAVVAVLIVLATFEIPQLPLPNRLLELISFGLFPVSLFLVLDQITIHFARPHWRKMREVERGDTRRGFEVLLPNRHERHDDRDGRGAPTA